jgi:hypothetical protein
MKRLFAAIVLAGTLAASTGGAVFANTSPNGPGQPGAPNTTCSTFTVTPGNSANANSPFNGSGNAGLHYAGNPGTASLANSNSTKAVSQYDIACFQKTTHG